MNDLIGGGGGKYRIMSCHVVQKVTSGVQSAKVFFEGNILAI